MGQSASWDRAVAILTGVQDRLDAALKQGQHAYEQAFDRTPEGVAVHELDEHAVIRRVNRQEQVVLGYDPKQLVGHVPWDFIVMNEVSQRAIQQKLDGTRELKPFLRTFRHASGAPLTVLMLDRHRKDENGRIVGLRTAFLEVKVDSAGNVA
jgi:PAS domain S-box-containing protein